MPEGNNSTKLYVNGINLSKAMHNASIELKSLASRCDVAEQTIRNYLTSTPRQPRRCKRQIVKQLATVLGCDLQYLILGGAAKTLPQCYYEFAVNSGFADPNSLRFPNLQGTWNVVATLDRSFDDSLPWRIECHVEFQQEMTELGPSPSVGFSVNLDLEQATH